MDVPPRILVAIAIVAACIVIGVPALIMTIRRRRRDKLRRRGIKHYNGKNRMAGE